MRKDESIFPALFNQCKSNQDRECLCRLFKEVAIKAQEFERAVQFREMQKKWRPCPVKSKPSKLGLNCSASKDRTGDQPGTGNRIQPTCSIPCTRKDSCKLEKSHLLGCWAQPGMRADLGELHRWLHTRAAKTEGGEGLCPGQAIRPQADSDRTQRRPCGSNQATCLESMLVYREARFLSSRPTTSLLARIVFQIQTTFRLSRSRLSSWLSTFLPENETVSNPDQELK